MAKARRPGGGSGRVSHLRHLTQAPRGGHLPEVAEALLDESLRALIGISPDGTIRSRNAAAPRSCGYTSAEAVHARCSLAKPVKREQCITLVESSEHFWLPVVTFSLDYT